MVTDFMHKSKEEKQSIETADAVLQLSEANMNWLFLDLSSI